MIDPTTARLPWQRPFSDFSDFDPIALLAATFEHGDGRDVLVLVDPTDPQDLPAGRIAPESPAGLGMSRFVEPLRSGGAERLGFGRVRVAAYRRVAGSNLDFGPKAITENGEVVDLDRDLYPGCGLVLATTEVSATAPLTEAATRHGFRGATMHGLNPTILATGLAEDHRVVSAAAEALRGRLEGGDAIELAFEIDTPSGLRRTEARVDLRGVPLQKSHGVCPPGVPDVANLPAGEIYATPAGVEGELPLPVECPAGAGIGVLRFEGGRAVAITHAAGHPDATAAHAARLARDPVLGIVGELGLGTRCLPPSGADIQDEKILGTCHVAFGRNDHLGGRVVPGDFTVAHHAAHEDVLFAPFRDLGIRIVRVRLDRPDDRGGSMTLIEDDRPTDAYLKAAGAPGSVAS